MDETISGGNRRRLQRHKVSGRGWTKARRATFLDMLAATCNVRLSCAHVGLSQVSAYKLRRRDPQFEQLWRTAIVMGYERLEEQLLSQAGVGASVNDIDVGAGADRVETPPFDPKLAMELLRHHRGAVDGRPRRPSGVTPRATREEAEAALLKKLDMLEKRLARERGEPE